MLQMSVLSNKFRGTVKLLASRCSSPFPAANKGSGAAGALRLWKAEGVKQNKQDGWGDKAADALN